MPKRRSRRDSANPLQLLQVNQSGRRDSNPGPPEPHSSLKKPISRNLRTALVVHAASCVPCRPRITQVAQLKLGEVFGEFVFRWSRPDVQHWRKMRGPRRGGGRKPDRARIRSTRRGRPARRRISPKGTAVPTGASKLSRSSAIEESANCGPRPRRPRTPQISRQFNVSRNPDGLRNTEALS